MIKSVKSIASFLLVLFITAACTFNPTAEEELEDISINAPRTGDGEDAETPPGSGGNN